MYSGTVFLTHCVHGQSESSPHVQACIRRKYKIAVTNTFYFTDKGMINISQGKTKNRQYVDNIKQLREKE